MSAATVPTSLPGIEGAVEIAFGEAHGCARLTDGSVRCWGSNQDGALGVAGIAGDSAKPVAVPGVSGATRIAAAGSQTCAAHRRRGALLGRPADAARRSRRHRHRARRPARLRHRARPHRHLLGRRQPPPARRASRQGGVVFGLADIDEIAAAGDTTCARAGGIVSCWGGNAGAQLGDPVAGRSRGAAPGPRSHRRHRHRARRPARLRPAGRRPGRLLGWIRPRPVRLPRRLSRRPQRRAGPAPAPPGWCWCSAPRRCRCPGSTSVVSLAHGEGHACALDRAGAVRCWGGLGYGELGNREHGAAGSKQPIEVVFATPSPRAAPVAAAAVVAAGDWSCAVLADQSVKCWGDSGLGQLGPHVKERSARPIAIDGVGPVADPLDGAVPRLRAAPRAAARCWGYNDGGQLGDGTSEKRAAPVAPVGLPPLAQIAISPVVGRPAHLRARQDRAASGAGAVTRRAPPTRPRRDRRPPRRRPSPASAVPRRSPRATAPAVPWSRGASCAGAPCSAPRRPPPGW